MITKIFIKVLMTIGIILGILTMLIVVCYVAFQIHWTMGVFISSVCFTAICLLILAIILQKEEL